MKVKKHSTQELSQLFKDGFEIDTKAFSEFRTNSLLYNGSHYGKKSEVFDREFKNVKGKGNIKVVENHVDRIITKLAGSVVALGGDMSVRPKNLDEYSDQKKAELHKAVLEDWKEQSKFRENLRDFVTEWLIFGEMFAKVSWNDLIGRRLPDKVYTSVEYDLSKEDDLEIAKDGVKIKRVIRFEGDVEFEPIYPYDVIRDAKAESFEKSEWVAIKKLVDPETLKQHFKGDDKKKEFINSCANQSYDTFRTDGEYANLKDKVLVREMYFRPSHRYPNGYYYIMAGGGEKPGILFSGELPGGIFPIISIGFRKVSNSPRHYSIIRSLRPSQVQINLMKSKAIEHILKGGSDKVYVAKGSNVTKLNNQHDNIVHEYVGTPPTVIPGRVGNQFFEPISAEISKMYTIADVEDNFAREDKPVDPHTALFLSAKQKARHSEYAGKLERFMKEVFTKVLKIKKDYMSEEAFVLAAGADTQVNISQFKSSDDIGYEIVLEGVSEDAESKVGRSLNIQTILQYGQNFDPSQLGALIRNMPYMNDEAIAESFTQDFENARNDICRLDRGDQSVLEVRPYENHDYMIQAITTRMKKPDFQFLSDEVKTLYQEKVTIHEQVKVEQLQQAQAIEADFIPTGGALLAIDGMHETIGTTTRGEPKTRRVRLPQEAISWLQERLGAQGTQLDIIEEQQNPQVQADIVSQFLGGQAQPEQELPLDVNQILQGEL